MATQVQTDIDGVVATLRFVSDAKVNVLSRRTCRLLDA